MKIYPYYHQTRYNEMDEKDYSETKEEFSELVTDKMEEIFVFGSQRPSDIKMKEFVAWLEELISRVYWEGRNYKSH